MIDIKIGVACHKPSELPKNELFLPIHVGAALSDRQLGIQRDDEGDNISSKNPQYCELTAQYWLWKNVKADYYGLCHYRRFMCFNGDKTKQNNRFQIEASSLNSENIKRFGLEDSKQMRKIIEKYDVITGMQQKVSNLYTPYGPKRTAIDHWVAHDRALIMKKDLEAMFRILREVSPELYASAKKYMNGPYFSGFNCFVMKREFFDEMCNIEFEVLKRLEKEIDFKNYNQQLTRIYGFMAEIISSSYIYHLQKNGKRVLNVPLVYFNYTDPVEKIEPSNKNAIPIIFNCADNSPIRFIPTLKSFFSHIDKKREYDISVVFEDRNSALEKSVFNMIDDDKNISLRFVSAKKIVDDAVERLAIKTGMQISRSEKKQSKYDEKSDFSALPFLPYLFNGYKRAFVFDEDILFAGSIVDAWDKYNDSEESICAPREPLMMANINDIYTETAEEYISSVIDEPYDYFSSSSMIMNFEAIRKKYSFTDISYSLAEPSRPGCYRQKETLMNILFQRDKKIIDQTMCVYEDSNQFLKNRLPYMPFSLYRDLCSARKSPVIYKYMDYDPWQNGLTEISRLFWNYARETELYDELIRYGIVVEKIKEQTEKKRISEKVFRPGTKARLVASKIIPRESKRYKLAKKVMTKIGIR